MLQKLKKISPFKYFLFWQRKKPSAFLIFRYKFKYWHLFLAALVILVGCLYLQKSYLRNTTPVEIDHHIIQAEIADSPLEQTKGLMFRKHLDNDAGMLFIFDQASRYPFWMKNTKIPLDILWINDKKEIVHIEHSLPPCLQDPCLSYSSPKPAKYVLEVNGGWTIKNGIKIGDKVSF